MKKRRGVLGTYAFVIGIYCGLVEWRGIDSTSMQNPEVRAELLYAMGGYALGTLLRWLFYMFVLSFFFLS